MAKKELKEEFPANSIASRVAPMRPELPQQMEEEKKTRKVTGSRQAIRRKRSLTESIAQTITSEETRGIGRYVVGEVLFPALKDTISEMFQKALEMFLYPDGGAPSHRRDKDRSHISYSSYYKKDDREERRYARPNRDRFGLEDIYFRKGDEASDVLEMMSEQIEDYGECTVADFFEFSGISGATHVHEKWGWTDLKRVKLTHTRQGYAILLPDPEELD